MSDNLEVGDKVEYEQKDWIVSNTKGNIKLSPSGKSKGSEIIVPPSKVKDVKVVKMKRGNNKQESEIEIDIAKGAKVGDIKVKESVMKSLDESLNLSKLKGATHITIRNAFFANYIAALLLLKLQDLKGLMLINDHANVNLTKFTSSMSDLNFWATALFNADSNDVKHRIGDAEAQLLAASAKKVTTSRVKKIMKVPLTSPDAINWHDAIAQTLLLQYTFHMNSSYISGILRTLHDWSEVNLGAKQHAINDAMTFMMQSDPTSKIIPHLRKLSNLISVNKRGSAAQRIVSFSKALREDEAASTSAANIGTSNAIINPSGSTNSQSGWSDTSQSMQNTLGGLYRLVKMAPKQITKRGRFTIRNGKMIKKRVKDFAPKKFKAPDFLKPKKKKTEEKPKETPDAV